MTRCRDDAVGALSTSKPRVFFDPVDGKFAGATENGKHRAISKEIDGVVTPFAGSDLAAVQIENSVTLAPAEGNLAGGGGRAYLAPAPLARFDFAECHTAPPCHRSFTIMIAPDGCGGKGLAG